MLLSQKRIIPSIRFGFQLASVALFLLLMSCSQWSGQQIKPTETRIDVVRDIVQKNWDQLESLRGTGRIIVESPQQSFSGHARINIKVPDSAYIKIEAILGLDVGTIFADENSFLIYSPMQKIAYQGSSADTLNLKMFLGFDLTFPQLMHTISGVPLLPALENPLMQKEGDQLKITGSENGNYYTCYLDLRYGLISKIIVRDELGQIQLVQEFKRFVKVGATRAPKMIRYIRPIEKESLTIFYDKLDVNKSMSVKDFFIKLPHDVFKIRL
jgi:outer membrane biogenesis lipoprotein LolB